MKTSSLVFFLAACFALLAGSGCENISTTPGGDSNRVISGTINFNSELTLPPGTEVLVRLVDTAGLAQVRTAASKDLPMADRPRTEPTPQVLAEQIIKPTVSGPVPFRLEYTADDAMLRHGLNIEARISYGGRVRLRTVTSRAITLANAAKPQEVWVEAVAR
jgi:uncharacterized lipoprotein YbaY